MSEIALYIDIEGFSQKFENGGRQSFIELTNDIFKLGQTYFKHMSFYQFGGDGFLIKEVGTYSNDLNKFVDVASALLQSILIKGGIGRVQISCGKMADIKGSYSTDLQKAISQDKNNLLSEYQNIMLINPVIGTAIINCAKLIGPSGPLLLVDKILINETNKQNYIHYNDDGFDVYGVNWLNNKNERVCKILNLLELDSSQNLIFYKNYIENNNELNLKWQQEAQKLIHLTHA